MGCCWALMLTMFAIGMGSMVWMTALAGVMLIEKGTHYGRRLIHPIGIALVVWGVVVIPARGGSRSPSAPASPPQNPRRDRDDSYASFRRIVPAATECVGGTTPRSARRVVLTGVIRPAVRSTGMARVDRPSASLWAVHSFGIIVDYNVPVLA